jgi:hypothetical protein
METKNRYTRQRDVIQAQLTWIQNKARPAFLCTSCDQRKAALVHLAVDSNGRSTNPLYPDVVYRAETVRLLQKRPHVQHWFFHVDFEGLFDVFIGQLKTKYSCMAIGGILGYLQPETPSAHNRFDYTHTTTSGSLQWFINQKLAFAEGISDWSLIKDADIQEKKNALQRCLPAHFKLELKIWKHTCEFQ